MATIYSSYTDDELATEIAAFRQARRDVLIASDGVGTVKRISDGDRTVEYTSANLPALDRELKALLAEQDRRSNPCGSGRAIAVEFD